MAGLYKDDPCPVIDRTGMTGEIDISFPTGEKDIRRFSACLQPYGLYLEQDVRRDFSKYLYQASMNRQYSFSMKGGGPAVSYYLSGGLDQNREELVRNGLDREITEDYASILSNLTVGDLVYSGPALPTRFGSLRNYFRLGDFSLGIHITL